MSAEMDLNAEGSRDPFNGSSEVVTSVYAQFSASAPKESQPLKLYDPDGLADGQAPHAMRDGDVFAFRSRGFWSWMIRRWQRWDGESDSRVSHVGFCLRIRGRMFVIEARERVGVRIFPFSRYVADRSVREIDWYRLRTEKFSIDRQAVIKHALDELGDRYASPAQFLRSFGAVAGFLCDRLGVPKCLDTNRFFCSQFVLKCLRRAGYWEDMQFDPVATSPGDVLELECLEYAGRAA